MMKHSFLSINLVLWFVCLHAFDVFAKPQPQDACETPNLLLIVDTSGSMADANKIQSLKQSLEIVVNEFKKDLRLGVVQFSGSASKLLVAIGPAPGGDINAHAKSIVDAVKKLQPLGTTPMNAAMQKAIEHYRTILPKDPVHQSSDPDAKRQSYIVLMTDGEPTDGAAVCPNSNPNCKSVQTKIKSLRSLVLGTKTYDIKTFVIGLGSGDKIRADTLDDLAKAGGTGGFIHAKAGGDLIKAFRQALSSSKVKEICNAKDDDCDGLVDEALIKSCSNACAQGKQVCMKGQWSACDAPPPGQEIC
ncbi:MAG: VWA domain-containing protein, partial [Myxococcota bacterium]